MERLDKALIFQGTTVTNHSIFQAKSRNCDLHFVSLSALSMDNVKRNGDFFPPFPFLLLLLMIMSGNSIGMDTLTQSQQISVGKTLVSAREIFELGLFSPENSTKMFIGIWYKKITRQKPIWVANRGNPLKSTDSNASLTIGNDGNLIVTNGIKEIVWSTNISSWASTIAVLSDQGNLILKDNVSGLIFWESFNYPGDTYITGMEIWSNVRTGERRMLNSWKTENDPSVGYFEAGVTNENPPQAIIWKGSKPFWRSGPWDQWKFIGLFTSGIGYSNGLIVKQDSHQGSVYLTYNSYNESYVTLFHLTADGNMKLKWNIGSPGGEVVWETNRVPCDVYNTCGPFGICNRSKYKMCDCLQGFVPRSTEWTRGNWTRGCVRRTHLLCTKSRTTSTADSPSPHSVQAPPLAAGNEESDGFQKLSNVKVPDRHEYLVDRDALGCKQWCLNNCSCVAYAHLERIGCMVWCGELHDIQQFSSSGVDIFLRLASSELGRDKKKTRLIVILTMILGVLLVTAMMYGVYLCMLNQRVSTSVSANHRIKEADFNVTTENSEHDTKSPDLPFFHFDTLAVATNGFRDANKLGAGGFGPVYKGKLEGGQEIAVKKLSSHSGQGVVEFKNEILLISKLRHRNLVRLIGYSMQGVEKLLIYEYLTNKSLDTFLFDKKKRVQLDWAKSFNIIEGIARGLLYLHRDSSLRIIHRDLKASNILLDDKLNPKISDFGLARAFEVTQELATHRVIGTYGYMSPEYALRGIFSEKSDVFSFGVLLLEIISGMKNNSFQFREDHVNLVGYAWYLWNKGMGINLMDKELSKSCTDKDFIKCLQIGLLCVQHHGIDRPTMSDVVLMLTGNTRIPQPQQPTFYHNVHYTNFRLQSTNLNSNNNATLSMIQGR